MAYILVPLLLLAVRDAHDACLWLKAAGFPQYVQMFEGKQTYRHNYDKHTLAGRHSHDMAFFFSPQTVSFPSTFQSFKWKRITPF